MKKLTLSLLLLLSLHFLSAQPKTEIRAVWLTTNYALDWPQTDKNADSQREKLKTLLDKLQAININTVFFQIQCRSDVFWDSKYQPWSRHITGTTGQKPSYDVVQFAIDECHKRNMEIHGWVVPYPQGSETVAGLFKGQHVSERRPDLCILYKNEWYLDPGLPKTTEYLLNLYGEVIEKYDLDALHLDYTRYPDANFPDDGSFANYGKGKSKKEWRIENINNFVYSLYDLIKKKKPDMKLTAAPIGAYESLPDAVSYFTARDHLFQDPVEWMSEGKLDMAAPQVYWQAGYEQHLTNWIMKSNGRPIVAGIAAYKMLSSEENWASTVVTGQIERAREIAVDGICFFRTEQITNNTKNIYTALKNNQFKYPANLPSMRWNGVTKPDTPQNIRISLKAGNTYTISWDAESDVKYYCVYTANTQDIDIDDVKNLAAHYVKGNSAEYTLPDPTKNYYFTVTAFDKGYYESFPSNVVSSLKANGLSNISNPETIFSQQSSVLDIHSEVTIKSVQVYSVGGSLLNSNFHSDTRVSIETGAYTQGVYIVSVTLEDGSTAIHKFIK